MLTSFHYCKHLWLAQSVISLGRLHLSRPERHRMPLSCRLKQLQNDCQYGKTECIRLNHYLSSWVIIDQNWCSGEEPLEFLKRFFCLLHEKEFLPLEFIFFSALEHVWKACGHPTECINELAVEICKPEELLDVSEWFWEWLFYYGLNTARVYWDTFLAYNEPYELDF